MSYGVIYLWMVKAECLQEHMLVMDAIVRVQRENCPEVLMNFTFGPSAQGECAEVQIFPDQAKADNFAGRVQNELPQLQELWERLEPFVEGPTNRHTFESNPHFAESFLRAAAGIGGIEVQG
jgi:inactivated superfamily I helicase